jgi:hypothetical protein
MTQGDPLYHGYRFLTDDYRLALDSDYNILLSHIGDHVCRQCGCFHRCVCPEGLAETYQLAVRVEVWEDLDGDDACEHQSCDTVYNFPIECRRFAPGEPCALCVWETLSAMYCTPDGYGVWFVLQLVSEDNGHTCFWDLEVSVQYIGEAHVTRDAAEPPVSPVGSYTDADTGCIENTPHHTRLRVSQVSVS